MNTHREQRHGALRYLRGVDGLRAVAVMAVLFYHAQVSWMPGGFLGVEVFFVISGYLITSLLLDETRRTGTVKVSNFWFRRARRLLPALFVMLGVTITVAVLFLRSDVAELRGAVVASFAYVTNWYLVLSKQSYFATFARPSLYQHLWSLAVEEQFYLFWPLLFAGGLKLFGRKHLIWGVVAGIAGSTALMWLLFTPGHDPSRVYYGTDTRAAGLLVGVALALLWDPTRLRAAPGRAAPVVLDIVGGIGLLAVIWMFGTVSEFDTALYHGGFLRLSLATAVVIAVLAHPSARLGRLLGIRPLLWLGLRSYSIYLWHWPVFMVTRPHQDIGIDGIPLMALRLAITFVLADLSYRFVEMPIRNGAIGDLRDRLRAARRDGERFFVQRWALTGTVTALAVLLVSTAVVATPRPAEPQLIVSAASVSTASTDPSTTSTSEPTTTASTNTTTTSRAVVAPVASTRPSTTNTTVTVAAPAKAPPSKVLAVGDSVMLGASPALKAAFGDRILIDAVVARQFEAGIWALQYHAKVGTLPDTVVVDLGNNGYFTPEQFDEMMQVLRNVHHVVFVTVKVNQRWQDPVNSVLLAGVKRWPNASIADWKGVSGGHRAYFVDDLTHLTPAGANAYAQFIEARVDR